MNKFLSILFLMFSGSVLFATQFLVEDYDTFNKAQQQAQSGDSLIWRNGIYENLVLDVMKSGIFILAEEAGEVVFTGQSALTLFGDSIRLIGFRFEDGSTEGDILKIAGKFNHLEGLNFSNYKSHYYLNILPSAQHIKVVRCNFEKKPQLPETSVVQIQVHESMPGYHLIQYCSFLDHTAPLDAGGDYGIEALRIGYSYQSEFVSRTVVEYCYFARCKGDGEIISSKARENIYRYNTFEDNGPSHFTLRHGSDNVVYSNFFLRGAGIRVKEGQNHMIYNNYFNTGDWFSIKLMNHKADPLRNIKIIHNSFIYSGAIVLGGTGPDVPQDVALVNNLFFQMEGSVILDPSHREQLDGNVLTSNNQNLPSGFIFTPMNIRQNINGMFEPDKMGLSLTSHNQIDYTILDLPILNDDPNLSMDIMQQSRSEHNQQGCFVPLNTDGLAPYVTGDNTGPNYLHN